jgi:hypothetical protein
VVDAHGTFQTASAACRASVKSLGHGVDFRVAEKSAPEYFSVEHPSQTEMAPVDAQEEFGPVARHISGVSGRFIYRAHDGAAAAFGRQAGIDIEQETVIAVLQDGGKDLQESSGPPISHRGLYEKAVGLMGWFFSLRDHASSFLIFRT